MAFSMIGMRRLLAAEAVRLTELGKFVQLLDAALEPMCKEELALSLQEFC